MEPGEFRPFANLVALIIGLTLVVAVFLVRRVTRTQDAADRRLIEYPPLVVYTLLGLAGTLLLSSLVPAVAAISPGLPKILPGLAAMSIVAAFWLGRTKVVISDAGLLVLRPLGGEALIAYGDIESITRVAGSTGDWKILGKNGRTLFQVGSTMVGAEALISSLERRGVQVRR